MWFKRDCAKPLYVQGLLIETSKDIGNKPLQVVILSYLIMKDSYLSRLEGLANKESFQRKADYIRYNFGEIIRKLKQNKDISVLEVGPGRGELIKYLNNCGIDDIDILDADKTIINSLRKNFDIKNGYYSDNIISVRDKLRRYDLIVLIQVMEHLPPQIYFEVIEILYSKIKDNGYILIVVPNAGNPLGMVERYGDLQHRNAFTEQSLKDLLMGSVISNYDFYIKGYLIPPYNLVNVVRIILQKILHLFLLALMVVNGGTYFRIMNPNITLIIKKRPQRLIKRK